MIKKVSFFTALFLFPFAANAVPAPVAIPQITIETAIQRFAPAFCEHGVQGLAEKVEQCYQTTSDSSVLMDMCILGDIAVGKILIQEKKVDLSILNKKPSEIITDNNIPVAGKASFLNFASIIKRLQLLSEMPRFYIYTNDQIIPYLQQGANPVYKGIIASCHK